MRSLWKNNRCPSRDSLGACSLAAVLMVGPSGRGASQESLTLARCDTRMSAPPMFPGQLPHWKDRLSPSLETDAPWSMKLVFTTGPRFVGADQSEKRGGSSAACSEATRAGVTARGV